jgi:hypothetical protein
MTATPHALTYDTLPAQSRLRREVSADGRAITISLPAGEVAGVQRRRALRTTALSSALMAAILLVPVVAIVAPLATDPQRRAMLLYKPVLFTLLVAVSIFVGALFLLVWEVRSWYVLDRLRRAAEQTTVLCSREDGTLLIESSGPLGSVSATVRPREARVNHRAGWAICGLELIGDDQKRWLLFVGLSAEELRWIARTVVAWAARP